MFASMYDLPIIMPLISSLTQSDLVLNSKDNAGDLTDDSVAMPVGEVDAASVRG